MFNQVSNSKLYIQIIDQIRNKIDLGELKPGEKLPTENELAQAFGTSRSSIREALSALEILGLIESKGRKNKVIKEEDTNQADYSLLFKKLFKGDSPFELFETRLELEPIIAYFAAERIDEDELKELWLQMDKLESIQKESESESESESEEYENLTENYLKEDRIFHHLIGKSAHNNVLYKVFSGVHYIMLKNHWRLLRKRVSIDKETLKKLNSEHKEILLAITERSPEKAQNSMKKHVENLKETLIT